MRYASERKAETRARVLREASAAIRANGVERVSVAAVMAAAGLTHGGFYAHFGSKDELVTEAIAHMFDERYARFMERIHVPDPREALVAFIDSYLSLRHCNAPAAGCPIPALASEVGRLPTAARERFAAGIKRLTDRIAALLTACGDPDATLHGASIVAELVGALALARSAIDKDDASRILDTSRQALRARLPLVSDPVTR